MYLIGLFSWIIQKCRLIDLDRIMLWNIMVHKAPQVNQVYFAFLQVTAYFIKACINILVAPLAPFWFIIKFLYGFLFPRV
jgi:hypothetical protein